MRPAGRMFHHTKTMSRAVGAASQGKNEMSPNEQSRMS
jgi:hypothetical protein